MIRLSFALALAGALPALCQSTGVLRGTVTLAANGDALHHATVRITQLNRNVETDDEGRYEFVLPPGTYTVLAHMHELTDESQHVTIKPGAVATADFKLRIATLRQEVTVTASGHEQTALETFQTVTAIDTLELAQRAETSLGEVLDKQPGIAKRSFGPGSSRPVIRGFDGDRVLVMQDGVPTGSISSQSGDHGESVDSLSLERLEVVKGPATLLYGSTAIGGVVNAITGHHQVHEHPHTGMRGSVTAIGGSNNGHAGGSGGFEYGRGNWLLWGDGSAQRTGDYQTPIGTVENSGTRVSNSSIGAGRYGEKRFFTAGYGYDEGRYGVPFAGELGGENEEIDLAFRRHHARVSGGLYNVGSFADVFRVTLGYSDWRHKEIAGGRVGTVFENRQVNWRGVFEQRRYGKLSGSFGFSGAHRDYRPSGEEAVAPPVDQNNAAVFGLEELALERVRIQAGGRVETNHYSPRGLRARSFTGFSGSAGANVALWKGGAFVTNYTLSYRAPALEELYNHGPHVGNLTFEIGNPNLKRERSNGIDLALRHHASRLRGEVNFFRYDIADFVFLAPTGEFEEGLRVADYLQAPSRFTGGEANLDVALYPDVWLNLGLDYVNARLKDGPPLPRIPPLRGRVGLDVRRGAWSLRPELLLANGQDRVFTSETRTAGYGVVNLTGSYTLARQHAVHVFAVTVFNAGDRLYRNHLSFIKEQAPEIGRGVRFTFTVRVF